MQRKRWWWNWWHDLFKRFDRRLTIMEFEDPLWTKSNLCKQFKELKNIFYLHKNIIHYFKDLYGQHTCCRQSIQNVWHLQFGHGEKIWKPYDWISTAVRLIYFFLKLPKDGKLKKRTALDKMISSIMKSIKSFKKRPGIRFIIFPLNVRLNSTVLFHS